jgi:hypothetical protein
MDWEKIKLGSWGAVGGALVTMYLGFNAGIRLRATSSSK